MTCRCKAYPFPHRMYSGRCGDPIEEEEQEPDEALLFESREMQSLIRSTR